MSLLRTLGKRAITLTNGQKQVLPKNMQVVSRNIGLGTEGATAARTPVSLAESVGHGVLLVVGCWAFPTWVLLHLDDYKGNTNSN